MQMTGLNWTTDCIASLPSVFVADRQDKHAHHCSRLAAAALLYVRLLPVNAQNRKKLAKEETKTEEDGHHCHHYQRGEQFTFEEKFCQAFV